MIRFFRFGPLALAGLCLACLWLSGCTSSPSAPTILQGTFALRIDRDTVVERGTLHLLRSPDGVTWGRLAFTPAKNMPWAVRLQRSRRDSLWFNVYNRYQLRLRTQGDTLRGVVLDDGEAHPATVWRQDTAVSAALRRLDRPEPMHVQGRDGPLTKVRWSTFADDRWYLADIYQDTLQVACAQGTAWTARPIAGQPAGYGFSGMDAAPDGRFLIAHGGAPDSVGPGYGMADIYYLSLNARGDSITQATLLPAPVSGPSHDIFPSLRGDSVVLFCAWKRPDGQGRGDLYEAPLHGPPFRVKPYADGALNTPQVEAGLYEDPQGRFVLYHRNTRDPFSPDHLYLAVRTDSGWAEPVKVAAPVNSANFEFRPYVGPAGTYLYWHSDRRVWEEIWRYPLAEIPELARFFEG